MLSAMLSTLAAKTKKVVAEPESPLDYETLLGVIVLSVCVMRPSLAGEALKFLAFGWAVVTAAARLGYTESDGLVVIATAFGLRAAEMLLKKGLTVLATFPLALTFKYVSPFLPRFSIPESKFFDCDGATPAVAKQRKDALVALQAAWKKKYPKCLQFGQDLKQLISDVRFTSGRCFPPFNQVVNDYLDPSVALEKTNGPTIIDIDDNAALDISGSYGVNVCGYEAYKKFIDAGWAKARSKGLFLGSLDPITLENIKMLKTVSGLDEISFHMSGTEAVMAAVRCARFNMKKPLVVTFGGAYHGWWDGMQPYVGNDRTPKDVLCLKDMNALSLAVIRARSSEIAAVLVNPLQCFHLNSSPPSDPVLSTNNRKVGPTPGYKEWLHKLRATCTAAGVLLIFDEVYTGFRLHPRGAQGAYDVQADLVTYGKTLGGGLPVGVLCGNRQWMTRTDPGKAARVAYVIGTFAGHPAVMGSMNAFLQWLSPQLENPTEYVAMHENIDKFIAKANATFKKEGYPLELSNWFSVWSMMYTQPGRYHWMLQYYMRDAGVNLSWVGTGRLLFSLDWTQAHYDDLLTRMLAACKSMKEGGWWEKPRVNVKRAVGIEFVTAIVKMLPKMILGL